MLGCHGYIINERKTENFQSQPHIFCDTHFYPKYRVLQLKIRLDGTTASMFFHRQLCSSNSHWCAFLISQNQSITRPYLFCEKQVFTFPKRSLGFKTVTSGFYTKCTAPPSPPLLSPSQMNSKISNICSQ